MEKHPLLKNAPGKQTTAISPQKIRFGQYESAVEMRYAQMQRKRFVERFWEKDATLWRQNAADETDYGDALGWLHLPEMMTKKVPLIEKYLRDIQSADIQKVVIFATPERILAVSTFLQNAKNPSPEIALSVLHFMDADTLSNLKTSFPLEKTSFVFAGDAARNFQWIKRLFHLYEISAALSPEQFAKQVAVIGSPKNPMNKLVERHGIGQIFIDPLDLNSHYLPLSFTGLLPAAMAGLDVREMLQRSKSMVKLCKRSQAIPENPGVALGGALGEIIRQGRSKIMLLMPGRLSGFGNWLAHLLSEGFDEMGVVVRLLLDCKINEFDADGEEIVFVHYTFAGDDNPCAEIEQLSIRAGHPIVNLSIDDFLNIGQEIFRWEIAAATAAIILGVNTALLKNLTE